MALKILPIYLNDHQAGSVAAIELVNHLRKLSRGTARKNLLASLQAEIEEETERLKVARAAFGA